MTHPLMCFVELPKRQRRAEGKLRDESQPTPAKTATATSNETGLKAAVSIAD